MTSSSVSDYSVVKVIGEGTFGRVTKIRRKRDGKYFCWKELFYGKMSEKEKEQLVSEVNILREMTHPNIVSYHDRVIDHTTKKIYIVMEYANGGDLAALIKQGRERGKYLEEWFIWRVFAELCVALHACHNRKSCTVLHRDIKPGNILLTEKRHVKLGDFGLARILKNSNDYARTHVGTPYYMSPEQVKEQQYNEKSDIWSLGCILYEMCALTPPFTASNQLALALKIQHSNPPPLPSRFSDELKHVISTMLCKQHHKRPSVTQLLHHTRVRAEIVKHRLQVVGHKPITEQPREKPSLPSAKPVPQPPVVSKPATVERKGSKQSVPTHQGSALASREAALQLRSKRLDERERALSVREKLLEKREAALQSRSKAFWEKHAVLTEGRARELELLRKKESLLSEREQKVQAAEARLGSTGLRVHVTPPTKTPPGAQRLVDQVESGGRRRLLATSRSDMHTTPQPSVPSALMVEFSPASGSDASHSSEELPPSQPPSLGKDLHSRVTEKLKVPGQQDAWFAPQDDTVVTRKRISSRRHAVM